YLAKFLIDAEKPSGSQVGFDITGSRHFEDCAELGFAFLQSVLRLFSPCVVTSHFDVTAQVSGIITQRINPACRPKAGAVFPHMPAMPPAASLPFCGFKLALRRTLAPVFGGEKNSYVLADDFFLLITEHPLGPRIPIANAPIEVNCKDRVIKDALHHQAEHIIVRPFRKFFLCLICAVAHRPGPRHISSFQRPVTYIQKELGGGHGALVTKKYCLSASFTSLKNPIQLLLLVTG